VELTINGRVLETTAEGFLSTLNDWDENVALEIARIEEIELTPAHWEIILYIQQYYEKFKHLPNARVFAKAIKNKLGEEKGTSRYLQRLFPQGPLKFACKIAGLPKPPTCL
jgi:tRNA 2-thiouridine synthesizing protein E